MRKVMRSSLGLAIAAMFLMLVGGRAAAQTDGDPYAGPTSTVLSATTVLEPAERGETVSQSDASVEQRPAVSASESASVKGATLAFTGGDVAALVLLALVLIAAGGTVLVLRRRTSAA